MNTGSRSPPALHRASGPAPGSPWHLMLGLSVWALWFVVTYAGAALACELAPPAVGSGAWNPVTAALLALAAVCMAWLARQAWMCARATGQVRDDGRETANRRFLAGVGAALHAVAAVGVAVVALPLGWLPPCL